MSKEFVLKEEHIKLLQNSHIEFLDSYETGAAGIDQKRPYGNSSVYRDVAEILEIEDQMYDDDGDETESFDDLFDYCMNMHNETGTALQVIISSKSFEPGTYIDISGRYELPKWERVEEDK